jgi:hypothetical protein
MIQEFTAFALARILQVLQLCAMAIYNLACRAWRNTIQCSGCSSLISFQLQIHLGLAQLSNLIITAWRLPIFPKAKDVFYGFL